MPEECHVIGLISDTHGLVRPRVHEALVGVELIITPATWGVTRCSTSWS